MPFFLVCLSLLQSSGQDPNTHRRVGATANPGFLERLGSTAVGTAIGIGLFFLSIYVLFTNEVRACSHGVNSGVTPTSQRTRLLVLTVCLSRVTFWRRPPLWTRVSLWFCPWVPPPAWTCRTTISLFTCRRRCEPPRLTPFCRCLTSLPVLVQTFLSIHSLAINTCCRRCLQCIAMFIIIPFICSLSMTPTTEWRSRRSNWRGRWKCISGWSIRIASKSVVRCDWVKSVKVVAAIQLH